METTLINNVAKCVEGNVTFAGSISTMYTVQDLFHMLTPRTLNDLYKRIKKELDGLDTDSLFESSNTTRKNKLQLQLDTVKGVFEYKQELKKIEKEKAERAEKRAKLRELLTEKQLEEFKGKSVEEIEKELAALESSN